LNSLAPEGCGTRPSAKIVNDAQAASKVTTEVMRNKRLEIAMRDVVLAICQQRIALKVRSARTGVL
jgi:hypothetical protein